MAQIFSARADTTLRIVLVAAAVGVVAGLGMIYIEARSDRAWGVGKPKDQPVAFRHDLHVAGLGLDCRFCHTGVERAASAGMPSAATCMTCHSQVWKGSTALEPLRTSLAFDKPITWARLHSLPDHTFFHHGIHVAKGIPCATCHGAVGTMSKTMKVETLSMGWCLDCHREALRKHAGNPTAGPAPRLTDCSTCHR